ncbi:hypothetical protein FM107_16365 [Sphingobacterium sp. JB170]|nr:hypothetical protein FM107_16365 [Sphingobacterium sp. JB170]
MAVCARELTPVAGGSISPLAREQFGIPSTAAMISGQQSAARMWDPIEAG